MFATCRSHQSSVIAVRLAIGTMALWPMLAVAEDTVQIGTITVLPAVSISYGHDDNISASPSGNEKSSNVTTIEPTLLLNTNYGSSLYSLSYRLRHDAYTDYSNYDNTDHYLSAGVQASPTKRLNLRVTAGFKAVQDTPSDTNNASDQVGDKREDTSLDTVLSYGAEGAKGRIELALGFADIDYTNNRDTGSETKYKDHQVQKLGLTFYYRVAPKTSALVSLEYKDFNYDQVNVNNLDSTNFGYSLGVTWEATAKTQGTVKIGRLKKDFDQASLDDPSGTSVDASITWKPKSYSVVTFTANKGFDEGSVSENFIDTQSFRVRWEHDWSARIRSDLNFRQTDKDYDNAANRQDDFHSYGLALGYRVNRWVDLEARYTYSENDSTTASAEYERNYFGLGIKVKL